MPKISDIKCVVFDLDGTIYFGDKLAERANEVISYCRHKFGHVYFATNNSAKTRVEIYEKLIKMGVDTKLDEILNSGYIMVEYLKKSNLKEVFCLGTDSLIKELQDNDINPKSNNPKAIVIGYDPDFTLKKLEEAYKVYSPDCKIIIANKDRIYPANGFNRPGAGAAVSAFEYTVNKEADVYIGKPSTKMLEIIAEKLNLESNNILMVGDNIESDIKMARDFNAQSILISACQNCIEDCNLVSKLADIMEII